MTVTASVTVAGATTISMFARRSPAAIVCRASAKPAARTTSATPAEAGALTVNRPSAPVVVCCSRPEARTTTAAPATTPPAMSLTTPVTTPASAGAAWTAGTEVWRSNSSAVTIIVPSILHHIAGHGWTRMDTDATDATDEHG